MTHAGLQAELKALGAYRGKIDGVFGSQSKSAVVTALSLGPDTPITAADIARGAAALNVKPAAIRAVWSVEANGAGFQDGLPKILPEPHRFSRATHGEYDAAHPDVSYPTWDPSRYPRNQAARYSQLAEMVALDVDAGLRSCSYGAFQIMGENHLACGFPTPWAMVKALSLTEGAQLDAFLNFVRSQGLDRFLRAGDWTAFALRYNGTAYAKNQYDLRLARACQAAGGLA